MNELLVLLLIPAILSLHLGLHVYWGNRSSPINRVILLISLLVTLWQLENALFLWKGPLVAGLMSFARAGGVLLAPSFLHLSLLLAPPRCRRKGALLALAYGLGVAFYLAGVDPHGLVRLVFPGLTYGPTLAFSIWVLYGLYFAACMGAGWWVLWQEWSRQQDPKARQRLFLTGLAALVALAMGAVSCGDPVSPAFVLLNIHATLLYLFLLAWNVWRYGLADLSLFMRQNAVYSLALSGVAGLYFLFALWGGWLLENAFHWGRTSSSFLAALAVSPTFYPVKEWLERKLRQFLPLPRDRCHEVLKALAVEVSRFFSLEDLVHFIGSRLTELLELTGVCLLYLPPTGPAWKWSAVREGGSLHWSREECPDRRADSCAQEGERTLLELPLWAGERQVGLLVLHRKASGEIFTPDEKEAFSVLAAQVGLALENIRLYREVLNKERQMQRAERLFALGRLTAGLAHEIRNGLYKIGGCAEILKDELAPGQRVSELATGIVEETENLAGVLDRFLSFAQEGNKEWKAFSVRAVVQDIFFSLRQELERKKIACHCFLPEEELVILGDALRIREAILNLVLNAIEAMEEKGGVLELRLKRQDGGCSVEVKDTGSGIPPQHLEEIFNPFFTTKPKGTGLGLPIANQIVREHGGKISVVSELGRGSTFTVVLPLFGEVAERKGGEEACGL